MRKIRTKRESFPGAIYGLLFSLLWYGVIIKSILEGALAGSHVLFLAAGLLPLYVSFRQIRSALYYRRLHRQYRNGTPRRGRIVDCVKRYCQTRGSRGRIRMEEEYILTIEAERESGIGFETIQSDPYSWPVYRVLSSPEVEVYTDENGWHHVIDGFQYKKRKTDPGIFQEDPFETGPVGQWREKGIFFLFFLIYLFLIVRNLLE